jgi:hypothetical protein
VDRGKSGSKIHVLAERAGLPLVVGVSAANTNDSYALKPLVMALPAVKSRRGLRRRKPPAPGSKIGGWVDWVQDPRWPECDRGHRMDHLLTVATSDGEPRRGGRGCRSRNEPGRTS